MDNAALKQVFITLHERIIKEVNPDSIIDELFVRDVIGADDRNNLKSKIPDPDLRCRKLLFLLRGSSHPETFIHLREALLCEYRMIVEEIDERLKSQPAPQPQLPHVSKTTEGKLIITVSSS